MVEADTTPTKMARSWFTAGHKRVQAVRPEFVFYLSFLRSSRRRGVAYWSISALLIARQPLDPSGSVMVTATGLRLMAARLTLTASTRTA